MEDTKTDALLNQVGGSHYKSFAIQPVEYTQKNRYSFSCGNVVKYVLRYKGKNGLEDLDKAYHYCELETKMPTTDRLTIMLRRYREKTRKLPSTEVFIRANNIENSCIRRTLRNLHRYHLSGNVRYLLVSKKCIAALKKSEYKC